MQILEIVLYNKSGDKRVLSLSPGKVNIITGGSATGKSAIIEIVDYCLGSRDCTVPEGVIRETVSWYGLLIQLDSGQMFVARENPSSNNSSTNRAYFEEGVKIKSPDRPPKEPNTTIETIVADLTKKLGIAANLNVPPPDQTRSPLEANFRHAVLFCFQQQDKIAQKDSLFHKSDFWVIQSIKDTLPYFLGAISEDHLVLQHELGRAKKELKKAETELQESEQVKGEGYGMGKILLEEAVEVGILDADKTFEGYDKMLEILKMVENWTPESATFTASDRLAQLQDEENDLISESQNKHEQIRAAKTFAKEGEGFENESEQQKLRLESIGLFDDTNMNDACPACLGHFTISTPIIENMKHSIEEIDQNLRSMGREKPRLREYIAKLENEYDEILYGIKKKRESIDSIVQIHLEAKHLRDINLQRAKVAGKISLWLDNVKIIDETSPLKAKADEARQKITDLENQLDEKEKESKMASILNIIGKQMSDWSKKLQLEHCDSPIRLDLTQATVVIDREDSPIPLKKMGSGQNWVGCHLIAHFALHQYFTKHNRPVPRFIFLDQPSQVYYPKDDKLGGSVDSLSDDDKEALFRIYDLIFDFVRCLEPSFQVIVTDHADLPNESFRSSIIERWREGEALIPSEWIR